MLKEYREKKNMSREKLEELTNLDRKTIFRIENDINIPLLDSFAKIVTALELTDEEIVYEVKKCIKCEKHTEKITQWYAVLFLIYWFIFYY